MSSIERKFRRRIRARMEKTGESYQAARRNLNRKSVQSPGIIPPFKISSGLPGQDRSGPADASPAEQPAARRSRILWARLKEELKRVASPREAFRLLESCKKMGLADAQVRQLIRNFAILPTGHMQLLALAARQMSQSRPIVESALSVRNISTQTAELLRQFDSVPSRILEDRRLAEEAVVQATRRYGDSGALAAAMRHINEGAVAVAMRQLTEGPVAAAMRYINEGPEIAAIKYIKRLNEGPEEAAMRYVSQKAKATRRRRNHLRAKAVRKRSR